MVPFNLSDLFPSEIRMMAIEGSSIRVLLVNEAEFVFKYETEAQLSEALRLWAENSDGTQRMDAIGAIRRFLPESKHGMMD